MLDEKDFIVDKRYKKKYRTRCDRCGVDRGYLYKNSSYLCHKCAIIVRNKLNNISLPPNNNFIVKNNERHYRAICSCGVDRGYIHKRNFYKKCLSCAAKIRNIDRHRDSQKEIQYRLRRSIRNNINRKLRLRNIDKLKKTSFSMLPYTIDDLIKHLESKFQLGMTWNNYGKEWHIDHITPDSWFRYNSIEDKDFKKSWALDNLQPMWAEDNLKKNNRWSG